VSTSIERRVSNDARSPVLGDGDRRRLVKLPLIGQPSRKFTGEDDVVTRVVRCTSFVPNVRAISELITVGIHVLGQRVSETDAADVELSQCV